MAEEKNKKELEQIRKQQNDARDVLEDLDIKQRVLKLKWDKMFVLLQSSYFLTRNWNR